MPDTVDTTFVAMDDQGNICGSSTSNYNKVHGFVLTPAGILIPMAGPQPSLMGNCGGINNNGRTMGEYLDNKWTPHGFVK